MADDFVNILKNFSGLYLIKDSLDLSGRFVAVESLLHFLKERVQVVYISIDHSFSSTKVPLRKCGLNPATLTQSGQLAVIELPSNPGQGSTVLQTLQQEIGKALEDAGTTATWQGSAIMLDDISVLAAVAGGPRELVAFLTWCRHQLAAKPQGPHWLLAVAHTDIPEDRRWLALLEHQCEVAVQVEPVAGGMADLQGQATITVRGATSVLELFKPGSTAASPSAKAGYQAERRLFFRAGDSAIRWVPQPSVYGT